MSCGSLSEGTQQKSAYWSKSESAEWEKTVRLPRRERAIIGNDSLLIILPFTFSLCFPFHNSSPISEYPGVGPSIHIWARYLLPDRV